MAQVVVLLHEEGSEDRCRRNRAGHFPTQQGLGDQIQIPSFEVDGCKKWSPPPDLNRGPADFSGCIGFFRRHSTVSRSSQSELGGDKPRIQSLYINFSFGSELPFSNQIRSTLTSTDAPYKRVCMRTS